MKQCLELLMAYLVLYVGAFCIACGVMAALKVFGVI